MATYLIASLALIVKPGPDLMCLLATALSEGRLRAFQLMAGQIFGCWLWILLLPLGIASFLAGHASVLTAVQIVGILYIGYLAVSSLREAYDGLRAGKTPEQSRADQNADIHSERQPSHSFFGRGVAMAMSNPLTILFFLAFLPQFTSRDSSLSPAWQSLLLGTFFCALVPFVDVPLVLTAGVFRDRLARNPRFTSVLKLVSGLMLAGVVIFLVISL